jgi:hypothetical protein
MQGLGTQPAAANLTANSPSNILPLLNNLCPIGAGGGVRAVFGRLCPPNVLVPFTARTQRGILPPYHLLLRVKTRVVSESKGDLCPGGQLLPVLLVPRIERSAHAWCLC